MYAFCDDQGLERPTFSPKPLNQSDSSSPTSEYQIDSGSEFSSAASLEDQAEDTDEEYLPEAPTTQKVSDRRWPGDSAKPTEQVVELRREDLKPQRLLVLLDFDNLEHQLNLLQDGERLLRTNRDLKSSSPNDMARMIISEIDKNNTLSDLMRYMQPQETAASNAWAQFSRVTSIASNVPTLLKHAQNFEVIIRAIYAEVCRSLLAVHDWLVCSGPALANRLFQCYRDRGKAGVTHAYPQFTGLVHHIFRYIQQVMSGPAIKQKSGKRKQYHKRQRLDDLCVGDLEPVGSAEDLLHIPPTFYGLRQKPTSSKPVSLPKWHWAGNVSKTIDNVYKEAKACFVQTLELNFILPPLAQIDEFFNTERLSKRNNTHPTAKQLELVKERCLTRGAVLHCLLDVLESDGIFASDGIKTFLASPSRMFSSRLEKSKDFAASVLKDEQKTVMSLKNWLIAYVVENPDLEDVIRDLGDTVHRRLLELDAGVKLSRNQLMYPYQDPATLMSLIRNPRAHGFRNGRLVNIEVTLDGLLSQPPNFSVVAVILREALARARGLSTGDKQLRWMLEGKHPYNGQRGNFDQDQYDPVRATCDGARLFQKHLPPSTLTGPLGISNLLTYMGTGQGNETAAFLDRANMPFDSFQACISTFRDIQQENKQTKAEGGQPIRVDNPRIYGSASNWLSVSPTVVLDYRTNISLSLEQKFEPYFNADVQEKWMNFLGEMAGKDPADFTPDQLPSWSEMFSLIVGLEIKGFGGGLTALQAANNASLSGLCKAASIGEIAQWVAQRTTLGAAKGLDQLGFHLSTLESSPAHYHAAFACFYDYLDEFLTNDDKAILNFGTIFVEHLLCKVARWTRWWKQTTMSSLTKYADNICGGSHWVSGADENDAACLPIPLCDSTERFQTSIDRALVSAF